MEKQKENHQQQLNVKKIIWLGYSSILTLLISGFGNGKIHGVGEIENSTKLTAENWNGTTRSDKSNDSILKIIIYYMYFNKNIIVSDKM